MNLLQWVRIFFRIQFFVGSQKYGYVETYPSMISVRHLLWSSNWVGPADGREMPSSSDLCPPIHKSTTLCRRNITENSATDFSKTLKILVSRNYQLALYSPRLFSNKNNKSNFKNHTCLWNPVRSALYTIITYYFQISEVIYARTSFTLRKWYEIYIWYSSVFYLIFHWNVTTCNR